MVPGVGVEPTSRHEASAAAHRLRCHGGLIGAQKLSQAAGALQVAVDNGDHGDPNFPTLLGAVEMAAAKAKIRVEHWISQQGANGEDPGVGIYAANGSFLGLNNLKSLAYILLCNSRFHS